MRWVRSVLVVIVLSGLGLFLGPASPACACSCRDLSAQESLDIADAVFVGIVTKVDEPGMSFIRSSADPVTVTFAVTEVFKGSVPADARVVTVADGSSCGYDFDPGVRYLVHARADGDVLRTGLCSGNQQLADRGNQHIGSRGEPLPTGGYPPGPATGEVGWLEANWLAVGIAGSAVLAGFGVWWWRRRTGASRTGAS